ncbi:MAG: carboxypeptidase regulatory-like domain-containing protein [Bacteroidales bacterium]|nr:carboxypeptidase regulatory-like domain-containing protein [Bacteroidales bacterium]
MALLANTPVGGVKGRVLSKTDRYPLEHARVRLVQGAEWVAEVRADANGNFRLEEIPEGEYTLVFMATGYLENRLPVVVTEGREKNVFNILLSEINRAGDSWLDAPYGSTDIHRNVKNYLQSGNASDLGDAHLMDAEIMMAGVRMDEVDPTASGFLSEALRESKFVSGGGLSETALGGFNGVAELSATAAHFRTGFYGSLWTDTAKYGLRADAAYGSGQLPGGWSLAANVAGIGWNKTSYDPYAVYVGVGKSFGQKHQLSTAFLRDQEPMAFLRYEFTPSQKFQAYTTVLGRFGHAGQVLHAAAAFTWMPGRHVRLSGGVDGRKGLQEMSHENRAEGWLSTMLSFGKWGFNLGGRGGYYTSELGRGVIYSAKAGVLYALSHNWQLSANTGLYRYNPVLPNTFASDVNVAFSTNSINLKLTGFYERYLGTEDIHTGLEFGFKVPVLVIPNLSLQGQVTAGHFGQGDRFECSFGYAGLSWNAHGWFADAGYMFDKPVHMIDTSAGKTWTFDKKRQLGVALGYRPYFGEDAPSSRFSFRIFCRI